MTKNKDLDQKANLASISQVIVNKAVETPELRETFNQHASKDEKQAVRELTAAIQGGVFATALANDEDKTAKATSLFDNMINRSEIWAKVLKKVHGQKAETYFSRVFYHAQTNSTYKDAGYTKVLSDLGATTLSNASREADNKVAKTP